MCSVSFDNLPRAHELRLAQRHVRGVVCVCGPCSARMNNARPDLSVRANVENRKIFVEHFESRDFLTGSHMSA